MRSDLSDAVDEERESKQAIIERTPGPWKRCGFVIDAEMDRAGDVARIARVSQNVGIDEAIANARFVVKACNAYDDLLVKLHDVEGELHRYCNGAAEGRTIGALKTALRELRDDVRAAIAKAE